MVSLHNSPEGHFHCLFNRVPLAQTREHPSFIVLILWWTFLCFSGGFFFFCVFETFARRSPQACSKPLVSAFWALGLQAWDTIPGLVVFLCASLLFVFVCFLFCSGSWAFIITHRLYRQKNIVELCENWIWGRQCHCIYTQEQLCPHIRGSRHSSDVPLQTALGTFGAAQGARL